MPRTITSANSTFVLNIPGVFPVPLPIQGYAADDAFTVEPFDTAEALVGVDGKLSAGYTPTPKKLTVMLQADSPSLEVFDAWLGAMESAREVFFAEATIVLPAISKTYNLRKGVLTNAVKLPPNKKVLQPVQYTITFESIEPALIAATI
jgi:hypothetical protein